MRLTKLHAAAACVLAALVALPQAAAAATYVVPIMLIGEVNGNILRISVDNGTTRRLGSQDGVSYFEADMEGNSCSTSVRVIFADAEIPTATIGYDVCSEEGIAINIRRGQ